MNNDMPVGEGVKGIWGLFADTDWSGLGAKIIDGLVNGLKAGYAKITGAFKELKDRAVAAFKAAFDMHSPSRLMQRQSPQIGAGIALGINDSIPKVTASFERLRGIAETPFETAKPYQVPSVAAPAVAGAPGSTAPTIAPLVGQAPAAVNAPQVSRGPVTLTIGSLIVNAATDKAGDIVAAIRDELARQIEGVAIEMGAA